MKPIGKLYFQITDKIFDTPVHVCLNYSDSDLACLAKKKKWRGDVSYNNFSAYATELTDDTPGVEFLVAFKHFQWTISEINTLVHEVVHVITKI